MSFIAVGVGAAGVAATIASQAMKKSGGGPQFDQMAAQRELDRFREQVRARDEYNRLEAEERARQRGLIGVERGRQTAFTDETNKSLGTQIARYDDVPGQVTARGQQLADYFGTNSGPLPAGVMPKMRSATTAAHTAGVLDDSAAFNKQQNTALGRVRSFGDLFGDIQRESLRDKTHMTNVADFKAGSKALLPSEIRPIINRQVPQISAGNFSSMYGPGEEPDNTFSDILGGIGSIATSYGMGGMGGFKGSPAGLLQYGSAGYPGSMTYGGPR